MGFIFSYQEHLYNRGRIAMIAITIITKATRAKNSIPRLDMKLVESKP
jgi:hypothetical protein